MCVIVVQKPNINITKRTLKKCYKTNPNGAGYMFTDGKKIVINKGFFTFKTFWSAYRTSLNAFPKSYFILHFRISTGGKINDENCHPFYINSNLGIAHNGILNYPASSNKSDTLNFTLDILQKLPNKFVENKGICDLISNYISSDKMVFLTTDNKVTYINEKAGETIEDSWFSNGHWDDRGFSRFYNYADWHTPDKKENTFICSYCFNTSSIKEKNTIIKDRNTLELCDDCAMYATMNSNNYK